MPPGDNSVARPECRGREQSRVRPAKRSCITHKALYLGRSREVRTAPFGTGEQVRTRASVPPSTVQRAFVAPVCIARAEGWQGQKVRGIGRPRHSGDAWASPQRLRMRTGITGRYAVAALCRCFSRRFVWWDGHFFRSEPMHHHHHHHHSRRAVAEFLLRGRTVGASPTSVAAPETTPQITRHHNNNSNCSNSNRNRNGDRSSKPRRQEGPTPTRASPWHGPPPLLGTPVTGIND